MQQKNRVICLDIGSHTIKALVGTISKEEKELLDISSVSSQGVSLGIVSDIDKCTQKLKDILHSLQVQDTDKIIIAIGGYYVDVVQTTQIMYPSDGVKITEKNVVDLYKKAESAYLTDDMEMLEVFISNYNLDEITDIANPVGMEGVKLSAVYNVFSCKKIILSNIRQCIENVGFEVDKFVYAPYYTSKILSGIYNEEGALVIDLGADMTTFSLFQYNNLYTSFTMPFGGKSLTLDIKNSYPVSMKQAELLKHQFAYALTAYANENATVVFNSNYARRESSLRVSELSAVVQARLDEIMHGVRYYLTKLSLENSFEKIVIIGGGSNLNSIIEYFGKIFSVSVEKGSIKEGLIFGDDQVYSKYEYMSLLGVLISELDKEKEACITENNSSIFSSIKLRIKNILGQVDTEDKSI